MKILDFVRSWHFRYGEVPLPVAIAVNVGWDSLDDVVAEVRHLIEVGLLPDELGVGWAVNELGHAHAFRRRQHWHQNVCIARDVAKAHHLTHDYVVGGGTVFTQSNPCYTPAIDDERLLLIKRLELVTIIIEDHRKSYLRLHERAAGQIPIARLQTWANSLLRDLKRARPEWGEAMETNDFSRVVPPYESYMPSRPQEYWNRYPTLVPCAIGEEDL